jgi:hypothetical protein
MTIRQLLGLCALALGLAIPAGGAFAQGKSQLAGTWLLVSYDAIGADGKRRPVFSAKPQGTFVLAADGHYAMVLVNPERPKKWSKGRQNVTAEEYRSAASGLVAQFGTWTVDEASRTLTRHVVGALNPMNAGVAQKLQYAVKGDELRLSQTASGVTGTATEQVFRRAK